MDQITGKITGFDFLTFFIFELIIPALSKGVATDNHKSRRITLVFLTMMVSCLYAQGQTETDSLERSLDGMDIVERMHTLNHLAFSYRVKDPEKTILYSRSALELALKEGNIQEERTALSNLGLGYRYLGSYDTALLYQNAALERALDIGKDEYIATEYNRIGIIYKQWGLFSRALEYYLKALSIREKIEDSYGMANLYNNIGNVYSKRGDFDLALEYFFKTLRIRQELGDREGYAYVLNNIGNIFSNLANYEKAIEYHEQSLEVKLELQDNYGIATSNSNLGNVYLKLGQPEKALEFFQKSLDIETALGMKHEIAHTLNFIGKTYLAVGNFKKALEYQDQSLSLMNQVGSKEGTAMVYIDLSNIYIQRGLYDKAAVLLEKSLDIAREEKLINIVSEVYLNLSEIYNKTGNPGLALSHYRKYSQARDSVFNSEISQKITELQISHIVDEYEQEKEILKKNNEIQRLKLKWQKLLVYFLAAFILLITALIFQVYSKYRTNRRANRILEEKNRSITEQNNFLEVLMDTIPNPMYYRNLSGRLLGCNKAFEQFVGKTRPEIMEVPGRDLCGVKAMTLISQNESEAITKRKMQQCEIRIPIGNKEYRDVILFSNAFLGQNNQVAGILGIMIDITGRKKAEIRLKHSEKQLREAAITKDKFFSIIAHDLSNPFNAILGLSSLLQDSYDTLSDEEKKGIIRNISNAAESTFRLLQNLLEWARSQTGKLGIYPENFDLNGVTTEILEMLMSVADKKNITLVSDIPGNTGVYADINMIRTVLRNLIMNAVKFTVAGGRVTIGASRMNGYYQVTVMDNGIGISKDQMTRLFRVDAQIKQKGTSNEEGSGLGLILCREFVEKNGGKIWAESKIGEGSRFIFTLPVGNTSKRQGQPSES
ncbi:MAG: tetratricopeptide repeat protein [Bacteroidales bacterium]|nr:tetratricopeptide repeat protein [Bacteroidales bacterium]